MSDTSKRYLMVSLVSTGKIDMLVSMRHSEKYDVPTELALLYDFVNTLDQRRYVENGVAHGGGDEIDTARKLEAWMGAHGLLARGAHVGAREQTAALELRKGLRAFLLIPPGQRARAKEEARLLSAASRKFPLILGICDEGAVELIPAPGSSALGSVLQQVIALAQTGRLERLKTCAADECRWIFFDRSKPANRHWCSSARCGNRRKTRAYRARQALADTR